jgi:hypothetical protein
MDLSPGSSDGAASAFPPIPPAWLRAAAIARGGPSQWRGEGAGGCVPVARWLRRRRGWRRTHVERVRAERSGGGRPDGRRHLVAANEDRRIALCRRAARPGRIRARPGTRRRDRTGGNRASEEHRSRRQCADPRHEACTDDDAEALGWSEQRATWQGAYADLVETNGSERLFEFVRVPRADPTARLRHRIFKCAYLDRRGTDLDAQAGAAGVLRPAPLDLAALQAVTEYLWQFTAHNNADHVVLASGAASATGGPLAWRVDMARLTRGATAADCDRIDRLAWVHTADVASGALTRRLETLETFRARRENGVVQLCAG